MLTPEVRGEISAGNSVVLSVCTGAVMDDEQAIEGANVTEIESLTLRAQELAKSVDFWNALMIAALVFTAIAAVAVAVTTRVALARAKQLADTQSELSEKAQQQTLAAQQALKRNIEDVARLREPRRLNEEDFSQHLKQAPKAIVELWYAPNDTEAFRFAEQIYRAVKAADWTVSAPVPIPADAGEMALNQPNAPPAARFSGAQSRSGLTILSKNPVFSPAKESKAVGSFVEAIGNAMNSVGSAVRVSGFVVSTDESLPDGVIRVVIEPRQ